MLRSNDRDNERRNSRVGNEKQAVDVNPKPPIICGNISLLRDYVSGKCEPTDRLQVEEHVETCERCAEVVDLLEFRWMNRFIPRSVNLSAPAPDLGGLLNRLRELPDQLN